MVCVTSEGTVEGLDNTAKWFVQVCDSNVLCPVICLQ
jgi:hypothetical protein